jgi:hypothetical protein
MDYLPRKQYTKDFRKGKIKYIIQIMVNAHHNRNRIANTKGIATLVSLCNNISNITPATSS